MRIGSTEDMDEEAYELQEYDHSKDEDDGVEGDSSGNSSGGRRNGPRRLSDSTTASFQLYTPDEEQAVVGKFDRRLVLFLALCYMLSFLDRSSRSSPAMIRNGCPCIMDADNSASDIGNARIAGMEEDLQTQPPRSDWYEWALSAFYISYIVFEWMSLLFKLVPAHILVSLSSISLQVCGLLS
jgi:hypothetical protein